MEDTRGVTGPGEHSTVPREPCWWFSPQLVPWGSFFTRVLWSALPWVLGWDGSAGHCGSLSIALFPSPVCLGNSRRVGFPEFSALSLQLRESTGLHRFPCAVSWKPYQAAPWDKRRTHFIHIPPFWGCGSLPLNIQSLTNCCFIYFINFFFLNLFQVRGQIQFQLLLHLGQRQKSVYSFSLLTVLHCTAAPQFICLHIEGLGCFQFGAITKKASISIYVWFFFCGNKNSQFAWININKWYYLAIW